MTTGRSKNPAHAIVVDVAATWQNYRLVRQAMAGAMSSGLLLHAAGATDDGFRTIDIWDSHGAWHSYQELLRRAYGDLSMAPIVRELQIGHLISSRRST